MFRRLFAWINRYERHLSAVAMVAGFLWDNIFFGRVDEWRTQIVFIAYIIICFVSIPLLHFIEARGERTGRRPRWRGLLPIATQFALGGFWSGFLIFYGRSASLAASWPYLLLLVGIFLTNEVLKKYHERLVFTSVLFFFALLSYAIFAVPVYTGTLGTLTFIESEAAAVVAFGLFTVLLRLLSRERFVADLFLIRTGSLGVLALITSFYFLGVLPPLPRAAEAGGIYESVTHTLGGYEAQAEAANESWRVRYLGEAPTLHLAAGGAVYAYSSVFAPTALKTGVVHRWQWFDPSSGAWQTRFALTYPITGGADGGYRGYSAIIPKVAGSWRVSIETPDGRVIARLPFTVTFASSTPVLETITLP